MKRLQTDVNAVLGDLLAVCRIPEAHDRLHERCSCLRRKRGRIGEIREVCLRLLRFRIADVIAADSQSVKLTIQLSNFISMTRRRRSTSLSGSDDDTVDLGLEPVRDFLIAEHRSERLS